MSITVIKNAPLPSNTAQRGPASIYPFSKMDIGDAFDAPRDRGKTAKGSDKRQNAVSCCARAWARSHNTSAKFTVRVIDENTVRCWRVA